VLARIYAARGIATPEQLETGLSLLIPFERLKNITAMATLLADAIAAGKRLLIVADYDSDGATACAVGMRALREFGATVDYLVPNRFEYGYGQQPYILDRIAPHKRDGGCAAPIHDAPAVRELRDAAVERARAAVAESGRR